jgi:hypothetical protein
VDARAGVKLGKPLFLGWLICYSVWFSEVGVEEDLQVEGLRIS